jgi:hypothetical protein
MRARANHLKSGHCLLSPSVEKLSTLSYNQMLVRDLATRLPHPTPMG